MRTVIKIARQLNKGRGKNISGISKMPLSLADRLLKGDFIEIDKNKTRLYVSFSAISDTLLGWCYIDVGFLDNNKTEIRHNGFARIADGSTQTTIFSIPDQTNYIQVAFFGLYQPNIYPATELILNWLMVAYEDNLPYERYGKTKYLPRHLLNRRSVIFE